MSQRQPLRQPLSELEAQQQTQQPTPQPQTTTPIQTVEWKGVPIDIYRYFGLDLGTVEKKTIEKISDIFVWALEKSEEKTVGNALQKIQTLETTLGVPHFNETRYDRLYNWITIQRQIDELRKRQDSLKGRVRI